MSITKYTNIDDINTKLSNEGKFIESDDLFIVSKNEIEKTDFGEGKYDIMEVSVYDVNNNLLPNKSGNSVAYIKKGDVQNYLYTITNKLGQKELAINIEKLLNQLGFTNGILKVNINFVRNRVGSDNELTRVWIQEVSPSREEIRILPLKTKDTNINFTNNNHFKALKSLNKEFLHYKDSILNTLSSFDNTFLTKIDSNLETKYGKDFFNTLKKDFGLSNFENLRTKIFEDFKLSVSHYLNNKYFDITQSNFGKPSEFRFENFEIYDYNIMLSDIEKTLNICIDINSKLLKRRDISITKLPAEFSIIQLQKQIQDNLNTFNTYSETKRNVYSPDGNITVFNDATSSFVQPSYPVRDLLLNTFCQGYDKFGKYADGNGGSYDKLIETNSTTCGYVAPSPGQSTGGGGGGGGGFTIRGGGNYGDDTDRPMRGDEFGRIENIR